MAPAVRQESVCGRARMVIVLKDGEEARGAIEGYDKSALSFQPGKAAAQQPAVGRPPERTCEAPG
jgi:hypothetical protein